MRACFICTCCSRRMMLTMRSLPNWGAGPVVAGSAGVAESLVPEGLAAAAAAACGFSNAPPAMVELPLALITEAAMLVCVCTLRWGWRTKCLSAVLDSLAYQLVAQCLDAIQIMRILQPQGFESQVLSHAGLGSHIKLQVLQYDTEQVIERLFSHP
jgi:hypothetical protein